MNKVLVYGCRKNYIFTQRRKENQENNILILEVISKPRLMSDSCVESLFKMLASYRVCCAFSSACALLSNLIRGFEMTSNELTLWFV
jgi:hypothetical protein